MHDPFLACNAPTPVLDLDASGSTNAEAMRLALGGETGPIWISARRQTKGRGRMGRAWQSLEGNLHASLLVTHRCAPGELTRISLLAGAALADAVAALGPDLPVELKWPNDLLLAGAKCAGVLIETTPRPSGAFACVLGFGVNVAAVPVVPDRPVTSLATHGVAATISDVRCQLDTALRSGFSQLARPDGFVALKHDWLRFAPPFGSRISITSVKGKIVGKFAGLGDDGALIMEDDRGVLTRISYGDVSAEGAAV
jgi:BirA family transcriptional regulator, biotin operon repressor / biotin---[acetyl-CoA-carboxylase] ligase